MGRNNGIPACWQFIMVTIKDDSEFTAVFYCCIITVLLLQYVGKFGCSHAFLLSCDHVLYGNSAVGNLLFTDNCHKRDAVAVGIDRKSVV